jgi:hypothetical protein
MPGLHETRVEGSNDAHNVCGWSTYIRYDIAEAGTRRIFASGDGLSGEIRAQQSKGVPIVAACGPA